MTDGPRWVLGADGCASGWVGVHLLDGVVDEVVVRTELAELVTRELASAAVDMPIGLVDAVRDADVAARMLLPGRASSVFSAPPASVVDGVRRGRLRDHAAASAMALATTGKGISVQSWRLVPKIIAVDDLVAAGHPLLEVHPEVAFAVVAGGPLPRKRSWSGVTTRRAILARLGIELPDRFVGDELAAADDVLDAAICAWVADAAAQGQPLVELPSSTRQQAHGRPIRIVARPAPPVVAGPRRMPRERRGRP